MAVKNLYVGNLPYGLTNDTLRELFEEAGEVQSANVILDRETQRGRGFGFVTMATSEGFDAALKTLNGREIEGRPMMVKEAHERGAPPPRAPRSYDQDSRDTSAPRGRDY